MRSKAVRLTLAIVVLSGLILATPLSALANATYFYCYVGDSKSVVYYSEVFPESDTNKMKIETAFGKANHDTGSMGPTYCWGKPTQGEAGSERDWHKGIDKTSNKVVQTGWTY